MTGLSTVLSLPSMPSAGQIVTLDLETVAVDLASAPLDEVLSFREAHGAEYRAYARDLRGMIAELSPLEPEERERRLLDRRDELADRAHDLRRTSMRAWRQSRPRT
jgi:hypothetical protein